jgi:hypothetical protein
LVTGTIAAHLEHYLREDKIKLEQVVTADKIKKVRTYLETHVIEGIVFWKDGQPWCKIKRTDFGLPWGR